MENKDFFNWLQNQLDIKDWNQADLAKKSGLAPSYISRLFNGTREPGPEALNAIAKALQLPPEEVFRAAGLLPPKPDEPPTLSEWIHIFINADESQQEEMLEYARFKARQQGQRKRPAANS